ncbi:MAG TPA: type II secretion system F family protein [Gaiellaceae bacterium]|nr:type II secretion system F family protein [Gaiellaceae bacterium]
MILLIGLVLLGAAIALIARGLIVARLRTADNLIQIGHYGFTGTTADLEQPTGVRGVLDTAAASIGLLLTDRLKLMDEERLRKTLISAGMYNTSPRTLIGYQLLGAIALPAIWIWISVATGSSAALTILAAVLFVAIGWFVPGFVVQRRASARIYRIDRAMPELIDLLVVTVEAGLSLSAALQLAGERMKGPLGDELRIVLQEQRMGLTPVQALENMVNRCPTPAVESFTRAMMQGQLLGVSVGQILRSLAIEMRKRRRAAAEQQAQKAPIKMLFPLVFMIFPSLFVVILGPALVSIFNALKG